ncbi:MAG TPA: periplasmic heavy metal sensor [Candidatus Acidoferrales bacterium]|nr:periplasmic heavy metal sensor [Candidatus Acidoferrales bacterium]
MNRSLVILVGALALGTAIFAGSFVTARHATVACCTKPADDLDWLRTEFKLSDAEMARVRALHEGYRPKCAEMCARIAEKKRELDAVLASSTNVTPEVQARMNELAALRAQCQTRMLQHFVLVSQAMPPEEGRRYLAEMKEFVLGSREQMEQSMSGATGHEHHP